MRVFLAGATGAIGQPLVRRLAAAGHDVTGITSTPANVGRIEAAGARGVVCDALDEAAVKAAMTEAGFRVGADLEAYQAVGCQRCNRSGYRGRVGIYSVMVVDDRIKELTIGGAPELEITRAAREAGMLTLREDGLSKVRAGVTSIEEVARVAA